MVNDVYEVDGFMVLCLGCSVPQSGGTIQRCYCVGSLNGTKMEGFRRIWSADNSRMLVYNCV